MKVSVIIPTYNGAKKISNVLSALEKQTYPDFETIVVVDGSTDNTKEVLAGRKSGFQPNIIFQPNAGRAVVRNRGAKAAQGDLLIFFDDDMRPAEDCIAYHIKHHQQHADSILTGAAIEDYKNAATDFSKYKCWLTRKWSRHFIKMQDRPLSKDNLHIAAANLSITRRLFFALGGFDERLTDSEDFDFAVRANAKNIPIFYAYEAFSWHDDPVTVTSYIKRMREYHKSHIHLRALKPDVYQSMQTRNPQHFKGLKKWLLGLFAQPFWIRLIEGNRLGWLPQALRYKIYALVTTSYGTLFVRREIK